MTNDSLLIMVKTSGGGAAYAESIRGYPESISCLFYFKGIAMNKAFKVLWNQVRNTYVVASEAQTRYGKPAKSTKTIVAAAVAGLMAVSGASFANTIEVNPEYAQEDNKLITGGNDDLNITTTASLGELVYDLVQANSFDDIRNAIEQDGKVITGVIGGHGVFDSNFGSSSTQLGIK